MTRSVNKSNKKAPTKKNTKPIQQKVQQKKNGKKPIKTQRKGKRTALNCIVTARNKDLSPKGKTKLLEVCIDYSKTRNALHCTIDGKNIAETAAKFGVTDITQVFDNGKTKYYPNREGVLEAFKQVCSSSKPGDFLVFLYSGHGSNQPDQNGDEPDGIDQSFCFISKNGRDIEFTTDDEVSQIIGKYLHKDVTCLFLIDACHSGTILDLEKASIYEGRKVICISGCADPELSGDTYAGGIMTTTLSQVLRSPEVEIRRKNNLLTVQYVFDKMNDILLDLQRKGIADQNFQMTWTQSIHPTLTNFPF